MTVTVRYTCPHCDAVVPVERSGELTDRSVTISPQAGWKYARRTDALDTVEAADGIEFRCGEGGPVSDREGTPVDGCGRAYYLNFVRFASGVELEPDPPAYGGPRFDFQP